MRSSLVYGAKGKIIVLTVLSVAVAFLMGYHSSVGGQGRKETMHLIAGDIRIELPFGWIDSSEYLYFTTDEQLRLQINQLTVSKEVPPAKLLDDRKERLRALGVVNETAAGETWVDGRPGVWSSLEITSATGEGEKQVTRLLVVKPSEGRAIVAVMSGPPHRQRDLEAAWTTFTKNLVIERVE